VESESLPLLGTAPSHELRAPAEPATDGFLTPDDLARIEQRIAKQLRGSGVVMLHDVAVPATATTIDHLCIGANAITAIDVERAPKGHGRAELVGRVMRETEILAAILGEAGVRAEQICGGVCRPGRALMARGARSGAITVCDVRGAAKLARRASVGGPIDVQLALAVVRNRLGYEDQRAHRTTRPDGYLTGSPGSVRAT
jgi:hypothetical protein